MAVLLAPPDFVCQQSAVTLLLISLHCRTSDMPAAAAAGTHREEVWHPLLGLLQQMLQVQKDALTALPAVDKGGGNTCLATAAL
jgi:hypothetical protein